MDNYLLINVSAFEIRIALVEHGNLVEYHQERPSERGLVGNIYRGRVVRVLPGMQAAFVDIGLERTGFLYVDDVHITPNEIEKRVFNGDRGTNCCANGCNGGPLDIHTTGRVPGVSIDSLLTEGQDIMVQVCKEPIGSKGARLTCHITLPCRNLVFMPMTDHIGISRKIDNEDTKQKLREEIEKLRPEGKGFIVRTVAAENALREDLEADMEFLLQLWSDILAIADRASVPSLIYEDLDISLRAIRDLFTPLIERVVVDDQLTHKKIEKFVKTFVPQLSSKVNYYTGETPLFDAYAIEVEISRAMEKKVWLRSGGYIIIESTEALTAIDVNTGSYVGRSDLEDTIFKTNMEAVKEIAYQLRLRNIGGIIIIDFIDMENPGNRKEVFRAIQEAAKKDKSRVNVLELSEFGLVQMTRKRKRDNLSHIICEPCMYCGGEGMVKSRRSICYEIFRKISRIGGRMPEDTLHVKVNPVVADMMLKEEFLTVEQLEQAIDKRIVIIPVQDLHVKRYEIF